MATRTGFIGLMMADSGQSPKAVAPFGGREARLGTNPYLQRICTSTRKEKRRPQTSGS
jgi:LDH2 family malate/lactate/ureidoglycolate dehydrogenase